jgi:hypothetical protein
MFKAIWHCDSTECADCLGVECADWQHVLFVGERTQVLWFVAAFDQVCLR